MELMSVEAACQLANVSDIIHLIGLCVLITKAEDPDAPCAILSLAH